MKWSVTYKKAIQDDGTLLFPERLTQEFLDNARRTQGSYIFANQYQNEIVPDGGTPFQKAWVKYYDKIPDKVYNFAFIDPALSEQEGSDYTACVVISVDENKNWYIRTANRYKITPTELVDLAFRVCKEQKLMALGIEDVAYQKALLYMLDEEMKRRKEIIPVTGIHPGTDKTKEARIMGLVPRFEWGYTYLKKGLYDLEMELSTFPRGKHDDLLDALSSLEQVVYYPHVPTVKPRQPHPGDKNYEQHFIRNLQKTRSRDQGNQDSY
jgi:predicted phage terminase large subunit-like protein